MSSPVIDLSALTAAQGFSIQGDVAYQQTGNGVSSAGDVNGDGIDDLIVGARFGVYEGTDPGRAHVVFGTLAATRANIDLTAFSATDGFIIRGDAALDLAGSSVSSAGDVNGDGFNDIIVGAPGNDDGGESAGAAYVIFGKAGGMRADIDLGSLLATDGFGIHGGAAGDFIGGSLSSAGDINGDGIDDFILGTPCGDIGGNYAGQAYVIFGKQGATRPDIDLGSLPASDGFRIQGDEAYDQAGYSVSAAGDINDDGIDDLIVGAPMGEIGGSYAGHAHVIFGKTGATRANIDLTSFAAGDGFVIRGNGNYDRAQADALYGEDGDDTLTGGSDFVTDILVGGEGNDILHGDSGLGDYDLMDGGAGNDTYYVDTPDDLTFEAVAGGTDTVIANIVGAGYYLYPNVENIVLMGNTPYGVGNDLNNVMTGSAATNWLLGGGGNDTLNGKGGNDVLFGEAGNDTFVFEQGTGGDVVGDFVAGSDKIDLTAFHTSFAQVQANMVENGGTTAINLGGGDFIVLNGVANAQLHAADFAF